MNAHTHTDFDSRIPSFLKPGKPPLGRDEKGRFLPRGHAQVDCNAPADLLPVDEYTMVIVDGTYDDGRLELEAVITEGDYEGMRGPFSLVLEGEGSDAGQCEFAALRRAVGVLSPNDTTELCHRPFRARVDVVMVDGKLRNSVTAVVTETAPEVPDWTPEQRFMFDLEGQLYKLTALATTLEKLLTPLTNDMAGHDRLGAALDYAVTNLADAVEEVEERYRAVRFPGKVAA